MVQVSFGGFGERVFQAGRIVVALYWVWVLKAMFSDSNAFDLIIINTAPMLLGLHFLQFVVFLRRLGLARGFVRELTLTLLFGMLHLAPKLLHYNQTRHRGKA